jgi:serpin B
MNRRTFLLVPAAATLLAALGLAEDKPADGKGDRVALVKGNNEFALDLHGKLRAKEGNLFCSPHSIATALAMTYAGARGETAAQMAKTLHFTLDPGRLHPAFGELIRELNGEGRKRRYQLTIANALWGQKGSDFLPEFLKVTKDNYGAGLQEVDFKTAAEKAREEINVWVAKETRDKIKDLIPAGAVDDRTRLVLTNAIYFKASWVSPFPALATKKGDFKLPGDRKVSTSLMHQHHDLNYLETDSFQALELPYERHELSMLVFLPKQVDGLPDFEKGLTAAKLAEWLGKLKLYDVEVTLPKF